MNVLCVLVLLPLLFPERGGKTNNLSPQCKTDAKSQAVIE